MTNKPTLNDIEEFSNNVVQYAENNDLLYLSALAIYCDEVGVPENEAPNWISENLKARIMEESQEENIMASQGKLPI